MLTVLGGAGFIGSHLVASLCDRGIEHRAPGRDTDLSDLSGQDLGHVVYCIGVTADFRSRPLDTVEAHVCRLHDVLRNCRFASFTYLSSTRVYGQGRGPATEDDDLVANPQRPGDLYSLSKATGEALVAACEGAVRSVRLSNVYGVDPHGVGFLPSVIRSALTKGRVDVRSAPESAKDYVSVADVVDVLPQIALTGTQPLYNLASGRTVTSGEILARLAELTGCTVRFDADAPTVAYPAASIARLTAEFPFTPRFLLDDLAALVEAYEAAPAR